MPSPVETALNILLKAKADVMVALEHHEHKMINIATISGLTGIINKLAHATGQSEALQGEHITFEPITDFMGEPIVRTPDIKAADLQPTPTEKEIFLNKVSALADHIRRKPVEELPTVINSYTIPEDVQVLRGVAKRAGLKDFADGTINIDFLERIKEGLAAKDMFTDEEIRINAGLAGTNNVSQSLANEVAAEPAHVDADAEPIGEFHVTSATISKDENQNHIGNFTLEIPEVAAEPAHVDAGAEPIGEFHEAEVVNTGKSKKK